MLTTSAALALALACAPRVAPDVLLSVTHAESHWRTLAIHDNVTGEAFTPTSKQEAEQIASRLIAEGYNLDFGLPQINAANLSHAALTIVRAFDAFASTHAGAQVLLEDYSGGTPAAEQQAAILAYKTGSPVARLRTYVPLALASAKVISALRPPGVMASTPPAVEVPSSPSKSCGPARWHYSADENCQDADATWHVSAAQNTAASQADTAARTRPISEGNP